MAERTRPESRVLPVLTVLATVALIVFMPSRYQIFGVGWLPYVLGTAIVVPMVGAGLSPVSSIWDRVERVTTIVVVGIQILICLVMLQQLLLDMIFHNRGLSAITLLTTSVALWIANVLNFALIYWQLDRGGPEGRAMGRAGTVDFTFTQGDPKDAAPRQPVFGDYLFLGFNTATAFSPTDTLPLSLRAKMLMMTQSTISLVTVLMVAARAINTLT
jgi:hypothetical protein